MSENFRVRRHRITIQRKIVWQDQVGGVHVGYEDQQTIWAEIRGDIITTRYLPDILPGYRVVIGEEVREIVGVIDRPGRTRLVELRTEEIRASAEMPDAQSG